ncbi:hypothetical protein [Bifidobacterium sp.]|jgi:hypothetical protein|uniref:hypothetical protein n=1 Tax=Bifidobacterium sp. TaxID=41200 RepID=UPI0025BEC45F|nr:hypothetical protein [Bifidobacterium sp.]MCH4209936.1 hypothetical protein [Bifidobacterium sp.]MCI1225317.1 hypothetical protein [Bifidobacterium sp.]
MTAAQEKREEPAGAKRPSKHAMIMRGVVAPLLGLLAIASIVLGYLNDTQWKPNADVTAQTTVSNARYIVTDPGVLDLVDSSARLTVESSAGASETSDDSDTGGNVCVALGSAKDVAGWTAGHGTVRITGLGSWTTLAQVRTAAQGTAAGDDANGVSFQDSDMWSVVECGDSRVTVRTSGRDVSDIALIDLGRDSADATVSLHWVRSTLPNFAMPLYFVGGLLLVLMVLAASVFAMPSQKRRKREVMSRPIETTQEVAIGEALTGSLHGLTSAVRIKPRGKQRHRHAAHRGGSAPQRVQAATRLDNMQIGNEPVGNEPTGNDPAGNASTGNAQAQGSPIIIDPAARNMVADQLGSRTNEPNGAMPFADSGEETSVISPDELQAYFTRLAQEISVQDADDAPDDDNDGHNAASGEGSSGGENVPDDDSAVGEADARASASRAADVANSSGAAGSGSDDGGAGDIDNDNDGKGEQS